MIESLATRDRRALIIGVIVIAGLAVAMRALPAWWRWRSDVRANAAEALAQQGRMGAVLGEFSRSLDTLSSRVVALRRLGPVFLTGSTPSEAASMLAVFVGDVARSSLVRVDAIELQVDTARRQDLPRIRAEVQATADVSGLAALLAHFERGPLLLSVERLSVRPQAVDSPGDQVESLAIRITVEGLALIR